MILTGSPNKGLTGPPGGGRLTVQENR